MKTVTPLSESVTRDKDRWAAVGRRILAFYGCRETVSEVGRCIDCWKKDQRIPKGEMIDGLGFLLGELVIAGHGGTWVWVVDEFGQTPAVQRVTGSWIAYVLDAVSKRLRDESVAERELPSLVDVYAEIS
jgi:hypothetical protein